MQVRELRHTLTLFVEFAQALTEGSRGELERFASILPASGQETTAAFVKRLKANLENSPLAAPTSFTQQFDAVKKLVASLGVKKTVSDDIALINTLWTSSPSASLDGFASRLIAARDYVPPSAPRKGRQTNGSGKNKSPTSAKQVTADYIEKLKQAALNPAEFEGVFRELQSNNSLKDASIKEIANKLNNYPQKTPERPKTREEAFQRILGYQHRKVGSESARKALELTPP